MNEFESPYSQDVPPLLRFDLEMEAAPSRLFEYLAERASPAVPLRGTPGDAAGAGEGVDGAGGS